MISTCPLLSSHLEPPSQFGGVDHARDVGPAPHQQIRGLLVRPHRLGRTHLSRVGPVRPEALPQERSPREELVRQVAGQEPVVVLSRLSRARQLWTGMAGRVALLPLPRRAKRPRATGVARHPNPSCSRHVSTPKEKEIRPPEVRLAAEDGGRQLRGHRTVMVIRREIYVCGFSTSLPRDCSTDKMSDAGLYTTQVWHTINTGTLPPLNDGSAIRDAGVSITGLSDLGVYSSYILSPLPTNLRLQKKRPHGSDPP
ncbi:hypothetical protein B296_00023230 [Ensete ventricosum]|uniref:Uncharacterized protein n=1 Tax=Ensete ventricosum TaxID=4639 RepID=A0A426ZDI9_ENSVE|nr:hypothetical protein B296_00023230 [Ensete ventricosum]